MKSGLLVIRMLVLVISLSILVPSFAQTQTPDAPRSSQDKLSTRLKARLPDYKGPSNFLGRKALIGTRKQAS